MTNDQKKAFTLRISQASPTGMITLLYEIVLVYLKDAKTQLQVGDKKAYLDALHHAQDGIRTLQSSLNLAYDPAEALLALYIFMHKEIATAIITFSDKPLDSIIQNMEKLRQAYETLERTISSESVMTNSQPVYAGLTYGRESLTETSENAGRGFYA